MHQVQRLHALANEALDQRDDGNGVSNSAEYKTTSRNLLDDYYKVCCRVFEFCVDLGKV